VAVFSIRPPPGSPSVSRLATNGRLLREAFESGRAATRAAFADRLRGPFWGRPSPSRASGLEVLGHVEHRFRAGVALNRRRRRRFRPGGFQHGGLLGIGIFRGWVLRDGRCGWSGLRR
jgi:hypothetical protein